MGPEATLSFLGRKRWLRGTGFGLLFQVHFNPSHHKKIKFGLSLGLNLHTGIKWQPRLASLSPLLLLSCSLAFLPARPLQRPTSAPTLALVWAHSQRHCLTAPSSASTDCWNRVCNQSLPHALATCFMHNKRKSGKGQLRWEKPPGVRTASKLMAVGKAVDRQWKCSRLKITVDLPCPPLFLPWQGLV